MQRGKTYNQIVQEGIERTKARMLAETDPQRIMIQQYHIRNMQGHIRTKRSRRTMQSRGGVICDIVETLDCG